MEMELEKVEEGRWRRYVFPYIHSNMYIWRCDEPGKAIVVDPNISVTAEQYLESFHAKDVLIILTHEHFDHTSGVNWLCGKYACKVVCHELCAKAVREVRNNRPLSIAMLVNNSENKDEIKQFVKNIPLYTCKADITFPGNYRMNWYGEDIEFQYCPGHSKGSVCVLLNGQFIFTGDSLIPDIPVITRYPSGSMEEYVKITLPYLKKIDDNVWIMPGHGKPVRMRELIFLGEKFIYRENQIMWDLKQYGDKQALISDNGCTLTYYELESEGQGIIQQMSGRCLVFSLCTNTIGSVLGYVTFLNNKIVPVLLNANMDTELLDELIETYHPAYLWIPGENAELFNAFEKVYEIEHYVLLKTKFENLYPIHEELGLLLTTSGSTGSPKFVRQSYHNVKSNAGAIVEYLELSSDERPITTLPMHYTYGLSIINSHLMVGASVLVTDKGLMQKEFWEFFKEQKATSFGGVPYTYEMLERLRFFRMDLPYLRYVTQAGGKLTPELHREFAEYAREKGKKFIVMYGQCEATARMGYLPADRAIEKCGSMGVAIPGGKFHLIDINGNDIMQPHTTGELVYEGPNVTMGYAECGEDLIKEDERGGILKTGDMAQFDEDGYYYIVGRMKRFLKIYGNRVNLDEIDRMIKGQYKNLDVASTGVDDHMYIFITDTDRIESVKNLVVTKTKLNPAAFKIIVIDEIPKNDAGKILYKQLSEFYEK